MEQASLKDLEQALGHAFTDPTLLVRALTHSSLAYERAADHPTSSAGIHGRKTPAEKTQAGSPSPAKQSHVNSTDSDNERLEFLGDAVVGLLVAESLYKRFPELHEGELTRLRANLISRRHLGQVGGAVNLGKAIRLGKGEERSGGRKKAALLANCMEAVIGALYLDGGLEVARAFIEQHVIEPFASQLRQKLGRDGVLNDHKSALQEYLQAHKSGVPDYVVKHESGPDHRKRFLVEVRVSTETDRARALARGIGTTKKKAEQEAARRAYEKLRSGSMHAEGLAEDDTVSDNTDAVETAAETSHS